MNQKLWTMRDGQKIELKSMTTLHIQNTVKMLNRVLTRSQKHEELVRSLSKLVTYFSMGPNSQKSVEILDQADSDLMMADVQLEQFIEITKDWINLFESELKLRETN